jgi:hypothetical protein
LESLTHNDSQNIWLGRPEQRLAMWRTFRKDYKQADAELLCSATAHWWGNAPLHSISLDPTSPHNWPDAWELIHSGNICKYSAALGIAYTIYYTNNSLNNIIMRVFDEEIDDIYNTTLINNQLLLGKKTGKVMNWSDAKPYLKIEEQWHTSDIVDSIKQHK